MGVCHNNREGVTTTCHCEPVRAYHYGGGGRMKTLHRHVGLGPIRASDDVCEKAIIIILPLNSDAGVALSGKSAEEM